MPTVELSEKIVKVLRGLIIAKKNEIRQSLEETRQISAGNIVDCEITGCHKHKGYGGTTFIVQGNLSTTMMGTLPGGMVIKFANNVEDEADNAQRLHELLVKRQKEWNDLRDEGFDLPESMRHFPERVYAPAVIGTVKQGDSQVLLLEFVDSFVTLSDSEERGGIKEKIQLLGYALARLHGFKEYRLIEKTVYEPLFHHMKPFIRDDVLSYWKEIILNTYGGIPFIHGDSHLQNVLLSDVPSSTALRSVAWIDAMLLPDSDRLDDIGYAISYIIQKEARELTLKDPPPSKNNMMDYFLKVTVEEWIPYVFQSYGSIVDLNKMYPNANPIDFFLGAHLIVRSGLWQEEQMVSILKDLGVHFIEHAPYLKSKQ
ncbi:MAG: hypothetical protein ACW981_11625 [Candidatus Hodarchaeales archaeon]